MHISQETWAIVAATGLGPILAVIITLWREGARDKYNRRLWVFRTLMATRKVPISNDHVNAVNMVEVDFYGCKSVDGAWKLYKDHLNTGPEDNAWREKKENLLAKLLFEIGSVLRFDIPAIDILKGGYAPNGWAFRDSRQTGFLEYFYQLSEGQKAIPFVVFNPPPPQQNVPSVPPQQR